MMFDTRRVGLLGGPWWGLVVLSALSGCGPGADLTDQALREARIKWNRANVRDYNLEWIARRTGRRDHYYVFVRGGRVEEIRSVLPDGRELRVKPGDPSFYGVDGLFQTLEEELDQARSERPFDQAPGTKVVMKFEAEPTLGYPQHYRRDVSGARLNLALDVVRLDANPKLLGPIPPMPQPPGTAAPDP